MSASLHLATMDDLDQLEPMVAAYHDLQGIETTENFLRTSLRALLEGLPHGVAYLIGIRRAPVGYIVISFGYSVELGGIDGRIDEFYIRENVRGRGMGTDVVASLLPALGEHGVKALHLEVSPDNTRAQKIYARAGFRLRDDHCLMSKRH